MDTCVLSPRCAYRRGLLGGINLRVASVLRRVLRVVSVGALPVMLSGYAFLALALVSGLTRRWRVPLSEVLT